MGDLVTRVTGALPAGAGWWGLGLSIALIAGSLALATFVVISWPPDHFKEGDRVPFMNHQHPLVRAAGLALKNLIGLVLLILGIIMVLPGVPGQGILTGLIGISLIDFPGKRRFERRLIARPSVLKVVNNLRAKFHKPALDLG